MQRFTLSFYLLVFLASLSAQRGHLVSSEGRTSPVNQELNAASRIVSDTILPAIFFEDCTSTLFITEATDGGYLAGTNDFSDKEKAAFIRYDAVDDYLINGVVGYFAVYDPEIADRFVNAKIYDIDPATDGPGNLLATSISIQVEDLRLDDELILATYFPLAEAIAMSSTDFFVSIDFTDVYTSPTGNISLFMTEEGCGDGFNAWERWDDDSWHAIDEEAGWAFEAEFFIGAVVEPLPSATQNTANQLGLSVFPNPASEQVNLTYTLGQSSEVDFTLLNLQGQEVVKKYLGEQLAGLNQAAIQLPELPVGLYVYQLLTTQGVASGQLVIR